MDGGLHRVRSGQAGQAGEAGWQAGEVYRTPEGNLLRTSEERATYLRTVQDWIIAPQMRSSPGLAGVDTVGGYAEYGVHPDSAKLAAHGLGLADLVTACSVPTCRPAPASCSGPAKAWWCVPMAWR